MSFVLSASAGQIANVQYIHDYFTSKIGVTVPINETNTAKAANVKYLLCAIDRANEISTESTSTTYCTNALATTQVVDTAAVADAASRLFNCNVAGYWKNGLKCESCPVDNYCSAGNGGKTPCDAGKHSPLKSSLAVQCLNTEVPPTLDWSQCTFQTPTTSVENAMACLGSTVSTAGHWQLISSYTGSDGDNKIKVVGSVPPGLYRIEMNDRSAQTSGDFASLMVLVNKTMYYAHCDWSAETSARPYFSVKNPFVVGETCIRYGALCDWSFNGKYTTTGGGCYSASAGTVISLDSNDGHMDRISGVITPGITRDNTTTALGASAIYKWVN